MPLTLIRDNDREKLHVTMRLTHPALTLGDVLRLGQNLARVCGNPVKVDYMTNGRGEFEGLKVWAYVDEDAPEIGITDVLLVAAETTPLEQPCAS